MAKRNKKRSLRRRGKIYQQQRNPDGHGGRWLQTNWLGRGDGFPQLMTNLGHQKTDHDQHDDGFDLVAEGSRQVREKLEDIVIRTKGFFRRTELEVDFPSSSTNSIPNKVEDIFCKTQDMFECDASFAEDDASESSGDYDVAFARRKRSHKKVQSLLTSNDDDESDVSSGIMGDEDIFSIEYPDDDENDDEEPDNVPSLFEEAFNLPPRPLSISMPKMPGPSIKSSSTPSKPMPQNIQEHLAGTTNNGKNSRDSTVINPISTIHQPVSESSSKKPEKRAMFENFLSSFEDATPFQSFLPAFKKSWKHDEIDSTQTEQMAGYTHLHDLAVSPRHHEEARGANPSDSEQHRRRTQSLPFASQNKANEMKEQATLQGGPQNDPKSGPDWQSKMMNFGWLHTQTSAEKKSEKAMKASETNKHEGNEIITMNTTRSTGLGGEIRRKMVQRIPRKCLGASPRAEKMDNDHTAIIMKSHEKSLQNSEARESGANRSPQMEAKEPSKPIQLVRDGFVKARQTLENSGRQRSILAKTLNSQTLSMEKGTKHKSVSSEIPLTPRSKMTDKLKKIRAGPKFDIKNRRLRGDIDEEENEIQFQSPKSSADVPKQHALFDVPSPTYNFDMPSPTCKTTQEDSNRSNTFKPIEAAKVTPLPESPRNAPVKKSIKIPKPRMSYATSPSCSSSAIPENKGLAPIPENAIINKNSITDNLKQKQLTVKTTNPVSKKASIPPKPLQSPSLPGGMTFQAIRENSRRGIQLKSKHALNPKIESPRESRIERMKRLQRQSKEPLSAKPVFAARRFTFDVI